MACKMYKIMSLIDELKMNVVNIVDKVCKTKNCPTCG